MTPRLCASAVKKANDLSPHPPDPHPFACAVASLLAWRSLSTQRVLSVVGALALLGIGVRLLAAVRAAGHPGAAGGRVVRRRSGLRLPPIC
jgi:hypothetical protein